MISPLGTIGIKGREIPVNGTIGGGDALVARDDLEPTVDFAAGFLI
jgi:hypothetical protein